MADLVVVERVPGTHVTDFGAPATLLASDADPVDDAAVERLARLLMACWKTFDERFGTIPVQEREAAPTRGRSPGAMRWHLVETDRLHAAAFGAVVRPGDPTRVEEQEAEVRQHLLGAWQAVPRRTRFTPAHRYGFAWTPHFAARRSAWHALDHAWQLDELAALAWPDRAGRQGN